MRRAMLAALAGAGIIGGAYIGFNDTGQPNCPAGWEGYVARDKDAHVIQASCENERHIVYLTHDGRFSQAFDKGVEDEWRIVSTLDEVEGWGK